MRYIIPIFLLLAFEYLVFQAVGVLLSGQPDWVKFVVQALYWSMPIALWAVLSRRMAQRSSPMEISKGGYYFSNSLIGVYFGKFVIALILVVDMVRRILFTIYGQFQEGTAIAYPLTGTVAIFALVTGGMLASVLIYGMFRNRYRYKIHRKQIKIHNLPTSLKGLKIIQISDIHSGSFTEVAPLQKGVNLINREAADLVFFTGDLVNNVASEMEPFIPVFKEIRAKRGVYSILGNHDYGDYVLWKSTEAKLQNFRELIRTHRSLGWDLLLNENRILDIDGASLAIIGVENYSAKGRFSKYGDLSRAIEGSNEADLKILLSHDPSHWLEEVVGEYEDIALTLSGHTHGMQFGIEIPGWFKWSPIQYIYKEWAGLYQQGKQYLYVNRGFGFLGYPGRVGILAEITVLTLE